MERVDLAKRLRKEKAANRASVVPYLLVDRRRLRSTRALVGAMRTAGAVAVELGFPFSDPIADGRVLQDASSKALNHHTTWSDLLEAVEGASEELPVAVMTYANPVFHRGIGPAMRALRKAGATGLIVPDLSLEEAPEWRTAARQEGIALALLAAPNSDRSRTQRLVRATAGFLYVVSRFGTTGRETAAEASDLRPLLSAAHQIRPTVPLLVGFGVRSPDNVRAALVQGADGVIVGSEIERILSKGPDPNRVARYLTPLVVEAGSIPLGKRASARS